MVTLTLVLGTWPIWTPPILVLGAFVFWLGFWPIADPPPGGPRTEQRADSPDPVSRTAREIAAGWYRPSVESLWYRVDGHLAHRHGIGLAGLPWTRSAARRRGLTDLAGWRRLRRDLERLLGMADRLAEPPPVLWKGRRRRLKARFERLTERTLATVERRIAVMAEGSRAG
ncbi:MAG: hypothetical protein QXG65_03355 [Thermoplasmata archaeon]